MRALLLAALLVAAGCLGGAPAACEGSGVGVGEEQGNVQGAPTVFVYAMHTRDEPVVFCARLDDETRVHEAAPSPKPAAPAVGLLLERPVDAPAFNVTAWLAEAPDRAVTQAFDTEQEETHVLVRLQDDGNLTMERRDGPPVEMA